MRSPHLAKGYLNDEAQTRERFIVSPMTGLNQDRWYKTGDLGRYLADGNVEFAGRNDLQVKIRGYRIELGEIEATLQQYPGVRDVVVVAREDEPGEKRLVAYLVTDSEQSLNTREIYSYLKHRLPEYMMPAAFVSIAAMPRTPNGKIDRRSLPAPTQETIGKEASRSTAHSWTEEMLIGIWEELLKREGIGVEDDFFELGGHSLLATQMVSRVRQAFQIEFPLRRLFESPTLAGLAEAIEAEQREGSQMTTGPLEPVSRADDLVLSFAQERLWFIDQMEPGSAIYNLPVGLKLNGSLQSAALEQSLREIVRRHEVLRTRFVETDGRPRQVIATKTELLLPEVDLSGLEAAQREFTVTQLLKDESVRAFDLSGRPLLRAALLRIDETEHVLALTIHHIVSDGWSSRVMIREAGTLYQTFAEGRPSPLNELMVQYADYGVWQREWLRGDELERQISYWKEQLAGAPEVLNLPTDRPRPAVRTYRGASQPLTLPDSLSQSLERLSRHQGVTLYMTLLAALKALLFRYTGQSDILVGTVMACRTREEIEPLIGFFVNTLVLRAQLSEEDSFEDLFKQVREVVLGAYTHQDLPFEKLVEELDT